MAFERFSRKRLEEFLQTHPLPQAGLEKLDLALLQPARKVHGSTKNTVSDNSCPKMGCNIQSESDTVEGRGRLDHIFDQDVFDYLDQPFRMEVGYPGWNNRRVRTPYTPDHLVMRWSAGFLLEEWKHASDRGVLAEQNPGRYRVDESGALHSLPAEHAAEKPGFQYSVRFSDEIPFQRTLNHRFLFTYLERRSEELYGPRLSALLNPFAARAYVNYEDLLQYSGVDRDLINWAIAFGYLAVPIDHVRLSDPGNVIVFRDSDALHAHRLSVGGNVCELPAEAFSRNNFYVGQAFLFDGIRFSIDILGITAPHAISEHGQSITRAYRASTSESSIHPQQGIADLSF
jgi:hypothetical protein